MRRGGLRTRRAAGTALTAVVLAAVGSGCGDLSRGELQRGVQSLSSLAAQGRLLGDGVARDRTKLTYTRAMARTLGEQSQHEAEKLHDAHPSSGLDDKRERAVALAGDIASAFSELQTFADSEMVGRRVRADMRRLQHRADRLDASLGSGQQ